METRYTPKALYQLLHVHSLLLLLTFSITSCSVQKQSSQDEKEILLLELIKHKEALPNLGYTKGVIGDSVILNYKIIKLSKSIDELKRRSIASKSLTKLEADEIFDKQYNNIITPSEEWSAAQLPNVEVILYHPEKHTSEINFGKSEKVGVGTFNILSLSKPIISHDRKYALIESSHRHFGGILHIYKKTDKGWALFKNIQLYLI